MCIVRTYRSTCKLTMKISQLKPSFKQQQQQRTLRCYLKMNISMKYEHFDMQDIGDVICIANYSINTYNYTN